jgi:hypothetical protein
MENYLNSFGKQVVNRAKGNIQRKKGGGTALENSIKFTVSADEDGFSVKFFMNSYGTFVDKGVSGNKKKRSYKDYNGKTITSPYKFTSKQPPPTILAKWISKKKIKGRDKKTGRFISNMSLAFLIGRKIKRDGIEGISFFQKPLGLGLKQYGEGLLGALTEDIIEGLTTIN